ncbi:MAG: hypothetical protein LBT00_16255 [Spirochaetaceae bacterium]|nr:hypothetical protein [Spirochaetaceae bacterium]
MRYNPCPHNQGNVIARRRRATFGSQCRRRSNPAEECLHPSSTRSVEPIASLGNVPLARNDDPTAFTPP